MSRINFYCAALVLLALSVKCTSLHANLVVDPAVNGTIFSSGTVAGGRLQQFVGSSIETRGYAEFDISQFASITSAHLHLTVSAGNRGGTFPVDFELRSYAANGAPNFSDFASGTTGTFVTSSTFNGTEPGGSVATFDVTAQVASLVASSEDFTGFILRLINNPANNTFFNYEGAPTAPELHVVGTAVPEPSAFLFGGLVVTAIATQRRTGRRKP